MNSFAEVDAATGIEDDDWLDITAESALKQKLEQGAAKAGLSLEEFVNQALEALVAQQR